MAQISRSKAKSAFPTHSTWLSTQSTAITIVTLFGERRVGSVSRSTRSPQLAASRRTPSGWMSHAEAKGKGERMLRAFAVLAGICFSANAFALDATTKSRQQAEG